MLRSKNDFPLGMAVGFFVVTFLLTYAHGVSNYYGLPDGPYCRGRYPALRCCDGRQDECSAPILDSVCYCDDFCNRTRSDDCCPDYWSHCKGINIDEGPGEIRQCHFKNAYYNDGQTTMDNCNECKCTNVNERAEMLCETNRCLIEPDVIESVNLPSSRLGWRAGNYSDFYGRTLAEGVLLKLGTLNPSNSVTNMLPVLRFYDPNQLPREFNAEERWKDLISGITDQGWCGASWAISTVDVASDRYAIMSMGREAVQLSAQHLLSCNNRGQQGCKGGYLDKAWLFTRKWGLVDEDCYPWLGGTNGKCRLPKKSTLAAARCRIPTVPARKSFYKVSPAYRLGNETDIMYEILTSGPVQATMKVYEDFFVYKTGVYKHSRLAESQRTGYHSVRIVGWGEELSEYGPPVKYWVVANSWGHEWGENGFFRILRGVNECEIETFVLAAWAKTVMKL
ncbi:uncharacterized peptidase C1-like protein F26E4.3 [Athalia rosae]|uniref:uncharacterized peptidase C1-like protein F26E4.3 n=1 Tax=Athalia rosae TaxID=37344 RepID=UPI000626B262|nr:uncharacterized peptidase C1-like protein F26E4.3 [Athalia rosae]